MLSWYVDAVFGITFGLISSVCLCLSSLNFKMLNNDHTPYDNFFLLIGTFKYMFIRT